MPLLYHLCHHHYVFIGLLCCLSLSFLMVSPNGALISLWSGFWFVIFSRFWSSPVLTRSEASASTRPNTRSTSCHRSHFRTCPGLPTWTSWPPGGRSTGQTKDPTRWRSWGEKKILGCVVVTRYLISQVLPKLSPTIIWCLRSQGLVIGVVACQARRPGSIPALSKCCFLLDHTWGGWLNIVPNSINCVILGFFVWYIN